jgi:hypothetical protein
MLVVMNITSDIVDGNGDGRELMLMGRRGLQRSASWGEVRFGGEQ